MPINYRPVGSKETKVYTAYSDDGGETWTCGTIVPEGSKGNGNEVQMVELADGSVLLNCRSARGNNLRKKSISTDWGAVMVSPGR